MKKQKGITLIALIITIVVLLILATVAITAMTQYNIIENANSAAKKYKDQAGTENTLLGAYNTELDKYLGGGTSGGSNLGGDSQGSGSTGTGSEGNECPFGGTHDWQTLTESYDKTHHQVFKRCSQCLKPWEPYGYLEEHVGEVWWESSWRCSNCF